MAYKKIYVLVSDENQDTHSQRDLVEAFETKEDAIAALQQTFFDDIHYLDDEEPRGLYPYEVEEQEEMTFTIRSKEHPELYISAYVEDVLLNVKSDN